jgi:drug/metabolite transporter (DMT)-like permease
MTLLWLPFSLMTLVLYGLGQVFAKETRTQVSSANYLMLLGVNILAIWGVYWIIFGDPGQHDLGAWFTAVVAAALSGGAYISYYESIKHGKVSVVGTIAGAYAPWTVVLALVFLGETMSWGEGMGVALVVGGMLLFTYRPRNGNGTRTEMLGILFALGSFVMWGTSAAVSKSVITEIGDANFIGVYALVCPAMWVAYWFATTRGRFEMPKANLRILELSMLFLALGGITLYVAFAHGNVSIVSPITNLYPVLTIAVAKVRLKESLDVRQYAALAMLIAAIPLFSL